MVIIFRQFRYLINSLKGSGEMPESYKIHGRSFMGDHNRILIGIKRPELNILIKIILVRPAFNNWKLIFTALLDH